MSSKPFWSLEKEYLEAYDNLERDCRYANNLYDALMTGANSIRLNGKYIGYVTERGDFDIEEKAFANMTDTQLGNVRVEFECLDRDDDGYTIAKFHIDILLDKQKWNLNAYEYAQRWLNSIVCE